jgi:hypothetical protein
LATSRCCCLSMLVVTVFRHYSCDLSAGMRQWCMLAYTRQLPAASQADPGNVWCLDICLLFHLLVI